MNYYGKYALLMAIICVLLVVGNTCAQEYGSPAETQTAGGSSLSQGEILESTFDLDGAEAVYLHILSQDPNSYDALWRLSRIYLAKGLLAGKKQKAELYKKGADYGKKAMTLNPDGLNAMIFYNANMGQYALFRGGKEKVRLSVEFKELCEKMLEKDRNCFQALAQLGAWHREIYILPGFLKFFAKILYGGLPPASIEEAEKLMKRAVKLQPENVEVHLWMGKIYLTEKKNDLAYREFTECLQLKSQFAQDTVFKEEAEKLRSSLR